MPNDAIRHSPPRSRRRPSPPAESIAGPSTPPQTLMTPVSPPPLRRDTERINDWLSRREYSPSREQSQPLIPTFLDRQDRGVRSGAPSPSPTRSHFPPMDSRPQENTPSSSSHQADLLQPPDMMTAAQSNLLDRVRTIHALAKRCIDGLQPLQYANHEMEKISEDPMIALNNVRPLLGCMDFI
jgi:hypothetical protein